MRFQSRARGSTALVASIIALTLTLTPGAQTRIQPHSNSFKPEQDVELGQQAAEEVRQQYPLLNDEEIHSYVARLGDQLVANIPEDLRQPAFRYTFQVVNLKEINAFALPGRADVPQSRHAGCGQDRRRSGRRHGARVESRGAAPRHRAGHEGSEVPDGCDRRPGAGRDRRRPHGERDRSRLAVRPRRVLLEVQSRVRAGGRPDGRADHGARRVRPTPDGQHVPDDPEAGRIAGT